MMIPHKPGLRSSGSLRCAGCLTAEISSCDLTDNTADDAQAQMNRSRQLCQGPGRGVQLIPECLLRGQSLQAVMAQLAQLSTIKTGLSAVQAAQQLQQLRLRISILLRRHSQQCLCPLQQSSAHRDIRLLHAALHQLS